MLAARISMGATSALRSKSCYPAIFTTAIDPTGTASRTEVTIWEKLINDNVLCVSYLKENIKTLYFLIWGQCSKVADEAPED